MSGNAAAKGGSAIRINPLACARLAKRRNLGQQLLGTRPAAIAPMPRSDCSLRVGGAGVGYKRHQIFEIARVAHSTLDALAGHYSGDDQR